MSLPAAPERIFCLLPQGGKWEFCALFLLLLAPVHAEEPPRPLPLQSVPVEKSIAVRDYGAIPDDAKPDSAGIQAALDAATASGQPCEIVFEKGRYDLEVPANTPEGQALYLRAAHDLVLSGHGALLNLLDPLSGVLSQQNCQRIIVRDFAVDYAVLPFSAGIIRSVHEQPNFIDLEVSPPHPALDLPQFSQASATWGYPLDPTIPGRLKEGTDNVFFSRRIERLPNGQFRIFLDEAISPAGMKQLARGDRYVQLARNDRGALFFTHLSTDVTYANITAWASTAGHFVASRSDGINVLRCRAAIRPGRWKAGNADAVHVQNSRIGPWVEECDFEGISDDCINIYTRPLSVQEQIAPQELALARSPGENSFFEGEVMTGDTLQFFDPLSGTILGEAKVTACNASTGRVSLDHAVGGLSIGTGRQNTQVYPRELSQGFVIRNNRFANSRRYGNLLKARAGWIENNRYEGLSSAALMIHNEPSWPEGLFSEKLWIHGNRMSHCGFEAHFLADPLHAVIACHALTLTGQPVATSGLHHDIRIEDNVIAEWRNRAVSLANLDGGRVEKNRFEAPLAKSGSPPAIAVEIAAASTNVTEADNEFSSKIRSTQRVVNTKKAK